MRVVPKPDKSVPVLEADGKTMSQAWDEFFAYLGSLNIPAFSRTAPTNGQVYIWNDTSKLLVPGSN